MRLWTWEAFAQGAEVVSYFRWRQAPFAQEQMHAGLNRPDLRLSPGGMEAASVARELRDFGPLPPSALAPVALVFDYEAAWITEIQPQGCDFSYAELVFRWYEAARRLGLDIDILPPGRPLDGYRAALVPSLPVVSDQALSAFAGMPGPILFGPRSGSKTRDFQIPHDLPPGLLRALLPLSVAQVASLRPGIEERVEGAVSGVVRRWREWIETDAPLLARFQDGTPALVGHGHCFYLAGWPDGNLLAATLHLVLGRHAGLALADLPETIRLRRRGERLFAFNYGAEPWTDPTGRVPTVGPFDCAWS